MCTCTHAFFHLNTVVKSLNESEVLKVMQPQRASSLIPPLNHIKCNWCNLTLLQYKVVAQLLWPGGGKTLNLLICRVFPTLNSVYWVIILMSTWWLTEFLANWCIVINAALCHVTPLSEQNELLFLHLKEPLPTHLKPPLKAANTSSTLMIYTVKST